MGRRPRRHPRLRHEGPPPRPVPEPRPPGDAVRPDPGGRRRPRVGRPPAPNADDDGVAQATDFMHNSGRPTDGAVRASGVRSGNVLIGTEEDFTTPCQDSGRIVAVDLTDSWGGEPAQNSTRTNPYRMKALDSFHPFLDTPETANPALGCSAHYFEIRASTLAAGWYGQGLRLVDVSDARDLRQIGYYRVTRHGRATTRRRTRGTSPGTTTAPRGATGPGGATARRLRVPDGHVARRRDPPPEGRRARRSARMKSVVAPSVRRNDRWAAKPVARLEPRRAAATSARCSRLRTDLNRSAGRRA